jgi:hypothetical protein
MGLGPTAVQGRKTRQAVAKDPVEELVEDTSMLSVKGMLHSIAYACTDIYLALTLDVEGDDDGDELSTGAPTPFLTGTPAPVGAPPIVPDAPPLAPWPAITAAPPAVLWATRPAPSVPSVPAAVRSFAPAAINLAPQTDGPASPDDDTILGVSPALSMPAAVHVSHAGSANHDANPVVVDPAPTPDADPPVVDPAPIPAVPTRKTRAKAKAAAPSAPDASATPVLMPAPTPTITITTAASSHNTDIATGSIIQQLEDEFHSRLPSFLRGHEPPPTPAPRATRSASTKPKPRAKAQTAEPKPESDLTDVEAEEVVLDLELEGKAGVKPKTKSKKAKGTVTKRVVSKGVCK